MTREELVENVAIEIFADHSNGNQKFSEATDAMQDDYRSMARTAIKITGEACAESLRVIADNSNNKAVSTTIGAANITILSLTQGQKT